MKIEDSICVVTLVALGKMGGDLGGSHILTGRLNLAVTWPGAASDTDGWLKSLISRVNAEGVVLDEDLGGSFWTGRFNLAINWPGAASDTDGLLESLISEVLVWRRDEALRGGGREL